MVVSTNLLEGSYDVAIAISFSPRVRLSTTLHALAMHIRCLVLTLNRGAFTVFFDETLKQDPKGAF